MNCTECGAELKKDALFCHKCGTRIRDMRFDDAVSEGTGGTGTVFEEDPVFDDFDKYFSQYDEPADPGKKKYYIIGALAAGLIVFILCFCNTNTFKRIFYKPVDYYRYVEKKNAVRNIELIGGWYKASGLGTDNGGSVGSEETFNLKLSEDILTPASDALGMGDLGFLSDIGVYGKSTVYDDKRSRNTTISLKDRQVLTLNTIHDSSDNELYIRIPELSDDYLAFSTDALDDMTSLIKNYVPGMSWIAPRRSDAQVSIFESLPESVKVTRIMNKYADIVFDNIKDVERSGREELELGGVGQKCYILTVKPGYRELKNIAVILRDTLSEDEDVKEIIVRRAEACGEDGNKAWEAFVDSLDILEAFAATCPDLEMKVYVDSHGNIICREIDCHDDSLFDVKYGRTINGREFGAQIYISGVFGEYGRDINIEGSGKKAGDKYLGDFTLSITDMDSIGFSLNSFDYKAFKDQKLNAALSVSVGDITDALKISNPSIEFIRDYLAVLSVESPDPGSYDLGIKLADAAVTPVICTYSVRRTGGSRITVPVNATHVDKLTDLKEYLQKADFDRVENNLEGAGVPESLTKYIDYIERAADYIDFVDLLL